MKFKPRAWDKVALKFREVVGISFYHGAISVKLNDEEYLQDDIDRFELTYPTGLTDVNGVEIYEGDIVRQYSRSGYEHIIVNGGIGVLEYSCGAFVIRNINDGRTHFLFYSEQEVLGNIYKNTDLLKETN